jgi:hypothetical protein
LDLMNGPEFEWEKIGDTWFLTGEYERYID